jgi:hypothetical protein
MRRFAAGWIFLLLLLLPLSAMAEEPFSKTDHLFSIERSKNRNSVHYDVVLKGNDDLADSDPVTVHWVLENGQKEELNLIQKRYAYGILSQEKLEKNRFRIMLAAFRDLKIIVERVDGDYKAVLPINGVESILDKIYVKAEERQLGLPRVTFIDVFGRALSTHFPVKERILPR